LLDVIEFDKGEKSNMKIETSSPNVKIFVSHRIDLESQVIDNPLYINVRCGAVYDKRQSDEYVKMLGDNVGDNISEKRLKYGELTVQYWAWKNQKADYYGLCHYRRYLSFGDLSQDDINKNDNGQIEESCPNEKIISKHKLNDEKYQKKIIENYDIIYGESFDIRSKETPKGKKETVYKHWKAWEGVIIEDGVIDKLCEIVKRLYPQYITPLNKYLNGKKYIGFNCYIMRQEYFSEMCEFQFGVLEELEREVDTSLYNEDRLRTFGFMGEVLYGTYIVSCMMKKNIRIKELPLVYFKYTKKRQKLEPILNNKDNTIPIVFMSSDFYVPYLYVCIMSLIEMNNERYFYDIIVLEKEISKEHKNILKQMCDKFSNISLRFYNPCYEIGNSKFYIAHAVYAEEAYYRMLTPWILEDYDKAIVMDSDIIIQRDVADLFNIELDNYYAAAVKDIVFQGILNGSVPGTYEYVKETMGMNEPYEYINTGVLLMNLKEIRKNFHQEEIVQLANTKKFRIQEQDILNVLLEGHLKFLDVRWNYYIVVSEFLKTSINYAPYESKCEYETAWDNPYFVHYAGVPKPWTTPSVEKAQLWWDYAKKSPFYEIFIQRIIEPAYNGIYEIKTKIGYDDNRTMVRKVADKLLPLNSKRRNAVRTIYHAISHRSGDVG
jgi:lipopolysaccharide biosynthesis glycosyltransferase